jgi:hypothetical protein
VQHNTACSNAFSSWRMLPGQGIAQAVFVVLARRTTAICKGESLACWLHCVASRIAMRAKQMTVKCQAQERRAAAALAVPPPDFAARELQALLDVEVTRLPEKLHAL